MSFPKTTSLLLRIKHKVFLFHLQQQAEKKQCLQVHRYKLSEKIIVTNLPRQHLEILFIGSIECATKVMGPFSVCLMERIPLITQKTVNITQSLKQPAFIFR